MVPLKLCSKAVFMSDKKPSSLKLRTLSALLIVPLFLTVIYFGSFVFFIFLSALVFISFQEWSRMARKGQSPLIDCLWGCAYISIGLASLFFLRHLHSDGLFLTLALIFMIWGCDTGAYFAGKKFGVKKLCPSISPGKTWAGLMGGIVTSICIALAGHHYGGLYLSIPTAIFIGLLVALTGQAGDLLISKFKRKVDVKDTGSIIPGHGGVLDRIDSLLFATPVYLIAILYLHQVG
jgi:phosphatidate cytidylyltransferase